MSRLPSSRPPPASKRPAPTITSAPTQATVRPITLASVAASLRIATATPTVNTGMVVPITIALIAVVRASPSTNSIMFAVTPKKPYAASSARWRACTRSRGNARSRTATNTSIAVIERAQTSPSGPISRSAILATIDSDANITCTASSARCTLGGMRSRELTAVRCARSGDGVSVFVFALGLAAAFDAVLLHELAEVLAIDVGLARRVRDVAFVLLEERQDVVALEGRDPALFGVLERRVDVGGAHRDGARRARAPRRRLFAAHRLRQIARLDHLALGERHRALDGVDELAHVSRPLVRGQ